MLCRIGGLGCLTHANDIDDDDDDDAKDFTNA